MNLIVDPWALQIPPKVQQGINQWSRCLNWQHMTSFLNIHSLCVRNPLYQVINHRYNASLPTVITTTLSLDEMESRMASRLTDPKVSNAFNIKVPDYRSDATSQRRMSRSGRRGVEAGK